MIRSFPASYRNWVWICVLPRPFTKELEVGLLPLLFWLRWQWSWDSNQCHQLYVPLHASTPEWRVRGLRWKLLAVCSGGTCSCPLGQSKVCSALWSFDILLGVVECAGFTPIRYQACPVVFLESKYGSVSIGAQEHLFIKLAGVGRDTVLAETFSVTTVNKSNGFFRQKPPTFFWIFTVEKAVTLIYYFSWRK